MSSINKLKLLLWKNFVVQKRHKWQTLFEILSPVILSIFLICIRCLVAPKSLAMQSYPPFSPTYFNISELNGEYRSDMTLAFSPENSLTRKAVANTFSIIADDNFGILAAIFVDMNSQHRPIGFKNAKDMEAALTKPHVMNRILVGIQFDDKMTNATSWPNDIKITLRFPATMRNPSLDHPLLSSWRTNLLFPLFPQAGPRELKDIYGGRSPGYSQEMFLAIQHALSKNIIKQKTGKTLDTNVYLQRLPQLASREDTLLVVLERFVAIIFMMGFAYTFMNTVKGITMEKELQLKETMAIMGLPSWLHWVTWFIKQFSFLFVTVVIIVILYKIPLRYTANGEGFAVFTFTPWTVLLFLMTLFIIVSLAFSFMVSVFFSKASTAASVMALIWFGTFAVFMFTQMIHDNVSSRTKLVISLLSNTAIGYAFRMLIVAEGASKGLQWGEFFEPVSYHDELLPGHVVIMIIVDIVLYISIALYVEKIRPGMYGVPLPWYFPFTKSFWICNNVSEINEKKCIVDDNLEYNDSLLKVVHEEEPAGVPIGVNIQNLTKLYKGGKKAVDNMNLRLYENEITVLLGHNGAGKTTTMSMLTGMVPPTSGSVTINGYNIVSETELARRSVGICPQHNVLFPDLTVAEHIVFYAKLKGVPQNKIRAEVDHFIKVLELEEKRDALSSTLSGGQKRRLSVGCAMCGASRVVLLDEPTSGLDPAARRALWDLLQKEKRGRTMILTTHFMDEADVLADRIAIMAGGRLQCVGTPYFLKRHYGVGYKLTVVKDDGCPVDDVTRFFKSHVPKVKINSDIGCELTYIFPKENVSNFPDMLREFEGKKEKFHVSSYGLSVTSLEEVFMKAGAENRNDIEEEHNYEANLNFSPLCDDTQRGYCVGPDQEVSGLTLLENHIKATFLKLAYNTARSKGISLIQVTWAAINVTIAMIISTSWKFLSDLPPLELSLEGYHKTQTIISQAHNLTDGSLAARALIAYKDYFKTSTIPSMTLTDVGAMDIEKFYLKLSETESSRVRYEALVGATFGRDNVTAWFSNYGYHDCATALALVDNAIISALSPGTSLKFVNHPLPYSVNNMVEIMETGGSLSHVLSFNLAFCIGVVSSVIVLFIIKERTSGAKLLQRVSGLRPAVLWGAALAWDWLWMFVVFLCIIGTIACFQEPSVSTFDELGRVMLVLTTFSFAIIPIHYLASFCFVEVAAGFVKMVFVNIFTGIAQSSMLFTLVYNFFFIGLIPFLFTELLRMPVLHMESIASMFDYAFSIFPIYCASRSIREMIVSSVRMNACDSLCSQLDLENCTRLTVCHKLNLDICCIDDNSFLTWEEPGVVRYLVTMVIVGVVAFSILLIKEYELLNKLMWMAPRRSELPAAVDDEDDDVAAERRVASELTAAEIATHSLVCRDLTKYYKQFLAVNRLTFAVRKGECFGLLGVNGAGKTSTFRMLTGDARISAGDAFVQGYSLRGHVRDVHRLIGYCPQFDALFDNLTGRETLRIFCLLRGIPAAVGAARALQLATTLGFIKHYDKKVHECSGGTKRKISTAIALLGDSPLIFLDEPTTGMDPASKRLVWACVNEAAVAGRSVVLTSHSMEECEALCSRLTIMVNGRLYCLGPLQHLKTKFSQGYTLIVKCSSGPQKGENVINIDKYITENFTGARLIESYLGVSTYYLKSTELPWWQVFYVMEKARKLHPIGDYSVSETTLEQVFLRFTKSQISAE
ncbi:LOW QUALITY PROTEIN: phospholipid-transporting ATPase ABCA1 [Manduca sexta]|uniref:LOW QUALITY PROTEIN: phospholipid-transporting ATPase ABCA1 n=1 Tax=Manduca sexta TaxID=7130 RepID=UPI00188E46CE|nr:LOW QUALITY PROTEIN: phospholipid-transporting ATPase ABCA1 [Manduca sexta]